MRLDNVVRDERRSIESILRALTNNLLARDNFAPDGEVGQVLMSNGPGSVPSFQDLPAPVATSEDDGEIEASRIVGTLAEARLQGSYRGITSVDELAVTEHQAALSIGWSQLTSVPTTIAGYGITDAYTKTEVDALLAALSLDDLDDVVITSPVVKHVLRHNGTNWVNTQLAFSDLSGSIADGQVPESAITQHQAALSIGWSQLTGVPTTLSGYGITDAYTKTETDTLLAAKADSATTLAGYGITDAYTKSAVDALLAALTTGDLTDWPADAAGVLTNDGAGTLTWEAGGGGAVSSVFGRTGAVVAATGDYNVSQIGTGTWQGGTYEFPLSATNVFNAQTGTWAQPIRIVGDVTGDAWQGALGWYDASGTRYGFVGHDAPTDSRISLVADIGPIYLSPAVISGDDSIYLTSDYIVKSVLGGTGQALAALAKEEFHFSGHQTPDNVQGLSWSWATVPDSAQAKVIVQMSGSYGSKMYFMTTNSFVTGAQTAMLIDHLGVVSINRSTGKLIPATNGVQALGDSSHLWDAVYTEKLFGKSGLVCGSGTILSGNTTATIACAAVTADSKIFIQSIDTAGEPARIFKITAKIVGTSFTVWRNDSAGDCDFHWFLIDSV